TRKASQESTTTCVRPANIHIFSQNKDKLTAFECNFGQPDFCGTGLQMAVPSAHNPCRAPEHPGAASCNSESFVSMSTPSLAEATHPLHFLPPAKAAPGTSSQPRWSVSAVQALLDMPLLDLL